MTQHEIDAAWDLVSRHGPATSWNDAAGALAAALGRALEEIERLQYRITHMENARTTPPPWLDTRSLPYEIDGD